MEQKLGHAPGQGLPDIALRRGQLLPSVPVQLGNFRRVPGWVLGLAARCDAAWPPFPAWHDLCLFRSDGR